MNPFGALKHGSGTRLRQFKELTERMMGSGSGQEARYRTVIEQSPLSIHVFAYDGSSLLANSAWSEL